MGPPRIPVFEQIVNTLSFLGRFGKNFYREPPQWEYKVGYKIKPKAISLRGEVGTALASNAQLYHKQLFVSIVVN